MAITRRPDRAEQLEATGARPVVCDVFDAPRLREVVVAAHPEAVVQHLTDLPLNLGPRNLKQAYARNDRVRGKGSANLVAAAQAAGARRYVAQNVSFLYAPEGPVVVDEQARLATDAPEPFGSTVRLHVEMERRIVENTSFAGLVLRFGFWYGPGTSFASDGYTAREVRRRRYPVVGNGGGMFSFVHIDDVVTATIASLDRGAPGVYNVVDDDPAPMREWLPGYAEALGAPRPLRVPVWLARLAAGTLVVGQATRMRGASNAKAKRELGWEPTYPTWREGFRTALG
ncbi:MAG: NAD-dependent epimerase/dehydratase family protein [Actinomycetota bacterium]|nr:NAD-dependent epimerase/dehydratase family protein [Actinomycetota bacterium]